MEGKRTDGFHLSDGRTRACRKFTPPPGAVGAGRRPHTTFKGLEQRFTILFDNPLAGLAHEDWQLSGGVAL